MKESPSSTVMSGPGDNVIFVGNFLYPHGMAETRRIQNAIDFLKARGYGVSVLLFRQSHLGRDENNLSGIHHGTPYSTIGHDVRLDWKLPFTLAKYFYCGLAYLTRQRQRHLKNIIYVYMEPNIENAVFLLYARLLGYRLVVDITEDYYFLGADSHVLSRIKAKTSEFFARHLDFFVAGIIVISSHLYSKFQQMYEKRIPVHLLPISVDFGRFSRTDAVFHDPIRMLYAGSFAEKDSVEHLIMAFEVVCKTHENIELILTGKGVSSGRMETIMSRIMASPFRDRIDYKGYLEEAEFYRVLNDCDIPCMVRSDTSYANTGFPFKLGEYLATGKPVVASKVGDVPEYLENGKNALLVDADSVDSIANALNFLTTHPREALEIGARGREIARRNFDREVVGRKLIEVLDRL
jgi:glycosyltransferase involved in cell wall biosynthesis